MTAIILFEGLSLRCRSYSIIIKRRIIFQGVSGCHMLHSAPHCLPQAISHDFGRFSNNVSKSRPAAFCFTRSEARLCSQAGRRGPDSCVHCSFLSFDTKEVPESASHLSKRGTQTPLGRPARRTRRRPAAAPSRYIAALATDVSFFMLLI